MFIQVLFICVLSNILLTESVENVFVDVIMPTTASRDEYAKQLDSMWTSDELKKAKPLHIVRPASTHQISLDKSVHPTGPASSVDGSHPSIGSALVKAISNTGRQVNTTGRVFFKAGSLSYSCSAVIVNSVSNDLIVTAGHCVYDPDTKTWYNTNHWVFTPAYSDGKKPYGTWPARRFIVRSEWIKSGDSNYDVAFVALQTVSQQHIQAVVGAQGIAFNQPRLAYTYSFGYPYNLGKTQYLKSCTGYTTRSQYTLQKYVGQALKCNMGPGSSGGPWLQNVTESTGIGYVTSVTSFGLSNVPNVINGPYFESNIKSLYDNSTSM